MVAKVTPRRPGTSPASAMMTKGFRRRSESETRGSATAPMIPPISMSPPARPACDVENPRGATISSIHVVIPLNIPRPTKKMTRRKRKSRRRIMLRRPSNMRERTSSSGLPTGVAGFSRATRMKKRAATTATTPQMTSMPFKP